MKHRPSPWEFALAQGPGRRAELSGRHFLSYVLASDLPRTKSVLAPDAAVVARGDGIRQRPHRRRMDMGARAGPLACGLRLMLGKARNLTPLIDDEART
ncbi:hypothetical protein THIARS_80134 [Thiomonas delicata]|uniref:Uncharacterized protein n=1 Tax=Thiomonas delicata TaxID=364030 RepID=A0A238D8V6_THIDL|nr:hypothetical protein THIARS_80134 [Thiomonas delicata]